MYDRILIGIDFSDSSVETVRWAVSRFPTADIVLFHAIEPLSIQRYQWHRYPRRAANLRHCQSLYLRTAPGRYLCQDWLAHRR